MMTQLPAVLLRVMSCSLWLIRSRPPADPRRGEALVQFRHERFHPGSIRLELGGGGLHVRLKNVHVPLPTRPKL